jgi:hypothetical protein
MSSHLISDSVVVVITLCFGAAVFVTPYLYRRNAFRILSRHAFDEPSAVEISLALANINASSSLYTFGLKRTANILFRGQRVSLVLGRLGMVGRDKLAQSWKGSMRLFALADTNQTEWMKANPDAFSAAHLALPFSVFWVKLAALKVNRVGLASGNQPGA